MVYQRSKHNRISELRFLFSGVAVLALLGFGVLADFSRPFASPKKNIAGRDPASISKIQTAETNPSKWIKNEILSWDCGLSDHKFSTTGMRVRISGNICAGWKGRQFEMVNQANGVTGTVFLSEAKFTTDFMHLQPGSNLVKAHTIDEGEELSFEFSIEQVKE